MGIEKIVKSEPIYEDVRTQVGMREKEMWVTSDGTEHYSLGQAEEHEFWLSLNHRNISLALECSAIDLKNIEEYEEYKRRRYYHNDIIAYDENSLIFPNTFVSYSHYNERRELVDDEEYDPFEPDTVRQLVPLSEYKKMINDKLDSLEDIEKKEDVSNES